jgi:NADPH:quinone reductase-like Zn-dependent oxidoreductase
MNCHTGHGDQLSAQKDLCCPLTRTFQCPWTPTSTDCGQTAKIGRASSVSPAPKHDFLRALGADEVIDYRTTDFAEAVGDIDVVLDTLGGDNCSRSLRVLRRGGTVVSILSLGQPDLTEVAWLRGVRVERMLVEHDHGGMKAIADRARAGKLHTAIADTFTLDEVAKAHELGDSHRTSGKLVLVMR